MVSSEVILIVAVTSIDGWLYIFIKRKHPASTEVDTGCFYIFNLANCFKGFCPLNDTVNSCLNGIGMMVAWFEFRHIFKICKDT